MLKRPSSRLWLPNTGTKSSIKAIKKRSKNNLQKLTILRNIENEENWCKNKFKFLSQTVPLWLLKDHPNSTFFKDRKLNLDKKKSQLEFFILIKKYIATKTNFVASRIFV